MDQPSNNLGLEDIDNTIEVTNPIDGCVPNLFEDQTVNPTEEESPNKSQNGKENSTLELAPVQEKEKKIAKRRIRKLIIDDVKEIDSASMKTQLSDTSNIIGQLELAPPTRRLMQLKETSGVDKMFSMTSRPLHSKTLLRVSFSSCFSSLLFQLKTKILINCLLSNFFCIILDYLFLYFLRIGQRVARDEHFYLFSFIKALYIKFVKTSKYGRNISRFS